MSRAASVVFDRISRSWIDLQDTTYWRQLDQQVTADMVVDMETESTVERTGMNLQINKSASKYSV